jgi:hypothetical protein
MARQLVKNVIFTAPDGRRGELHPGDKIPSHFSQDSIERLERIGALVDTADSDYSKLKVPELVEEAEDRGLEVPENAKKADLVALLEAHDAGTTE